MINSMESTDFNGCKNMIYKLALNRYGKMKHNRPDVEFDDVLAEAYLIYAWCLKNFSNEKNTKFSTYLYIQLRGRLADYYDVTYKVMDLYENIVENNEDKDDYESTIISKEYDLSDETNEIYERGKEELSYEGYEVLKYLLSRKWENEKRHNYPNVGQITAELGYPRDVVLSSMGEIKAFWQRRPTLRSEKFFYNKSNDDKRTTEKQNSRTSRVEVFI